MSTKQNTEVTIIYNLITRVTPHHSGYILFTRNKSLGPAHTQGRGVHTCGFENKETGTIGMLPVMGPWLSRQAP